tara:strand:+ start:440 stop:1264 length:825 start_codon:yes stop_codon:yes gene_type:complete
MKYLIIKQSCLDTTQFDSGMWDSRFTFIEMYDLQNLSCIEISDELYGIHHKGWEGKYIEITKDLATNGSTFFSEVRDVSKVWEVGDGVPEGLTEEQMRNMDYPDGVKYGKVPVTMTDEIKADTLNFMKIFAKELIEDEYEKRFLSLRDTGLLEVASWEIQKHEAREHLAGAGGNTPFLDYLATQHSKDKTVLANKILSKAESYEDKVSTLLVAMQKLLKQFENTTSIRDINTLYEDYLGVLMPTIQAIEMGRTVSNTDWERKPEYEVKANEYNF